MPTHLRHVLIQHSAADGTALGAGHGEAVLDGEALARLRELDPSGKGGLVARVLNTYIASLGKLLEQLSTARSAHDLPALRHVAHTLKSSSASVGALHLSALCADIERRVRDGQAEGLELQLEAMAHEGARVLHALRPQSRQ